ncbi:hypothetical protein QQF64_014929 [Cirrhinus molitorella]|uniref:Uncharacterized protein n=1 Tax=Cirrhinus molitorella TaxID=172907 RepID=A0ABR3NTU9_9TELE
MKGCIEEGRKERGRERGKTIYLNSTYQGQTMGYDICKQLKNSLLAQNRHTQRRVEIALSLVGTMWQLSSLYRSMLIKQRRSMLETQVGLKWIGFCLPRLGLFDCGACVQEFVVCLRDLV